MAEFSLIEVLQAVNGLIYSDTDEAWFSGISTDTRTLKQGDLFVALIGENFDGHNFINQALDKGAAGVIISKDLEIDKECAVIMVPDTLKALTDLAHFHRSRFKIPVVAVTGSNGKTTTKDMIASVLATGLNVLKTEANYNNEIGLSQTLLKLDASHQAVVLEMGMRGKGQIAELAQIAMPTIGVVTNVGETHIELLGTVDNIAAAKAELIESLQSGNLAILNIDDEHVKAMSNKAKCSAWYYGIYEQTDFTAVNIQIEKLKTKYICILSTGENIDIEIPLVGIHNVYNSLAALAVGKALGLSTSQIQQGLKNVVLTAMRQHIEVINDVTIINDAYNASPLSMSAAIDTLKQVSQGRQAAILGDMLELGDVAVEAHRRVGYKLAENKVDIIITVGSLAAHIADAASEQYAGIIIKCENHQAAIEAIREVVKPGDTVLIKGSRGMSMEKVLGGLSCSSCCMQQD